MFENLSTREKLVWIGRWLGDVAIMYQATGYDAIKIQKTRNYIFDNAADVAEKWDTLEKAKKENNK